MPKNKKERGKRPVVEVLNLFEAKGEPVETGRDGLLSRIARYRLSLASLAIRARRDTFSVTFPGSCPDQ